MSFRIEFDNLHGIIRNRKISTWELRALVRCVRFFNFSAGPRFARQTLSRSMLCCFVAILVEIDRIGSSHAGPAQSLHARHSIAQMQSM